jgi:DNA-binding SARP family transcriptional activator
MTAAAGGPMRVGVLGPVQVWRDGRLVDLGTPRQRSILAALALSPGRTVPLETLVARVWGDDAPATAISTLQRYVASLRRAVEPDRAAHEPPAVIVTDGGGYTLRVPGTARDVATLEAAVTEARELLAGVPDLLRPQVTPDGADDAARAAEVIRSGLALWRGDPYADLGDDPEASAERVRLEDVRTAALELRLVALMALGRHTEVVGELESMTSLHPLHERWWALYAVALVRSGRQAEALEALGTLRSLLADELGVDPSAPLRDLHTAILRQDPSLEWRAGEVPVAPSPLTDPAPARATDAPARPRWPLAGRQPELDRLSTALDESREHRAGAALVAGEAGVGKTRLVQELAQVAHAAGFTVVTTGCSQQSPPALWPLRRALVALDRQLSGFDFDPAAVDTHPDDFGTREQVADALLGASATGPVLLVVEDVQWADPATLQVLESLLAARGSAMLMIALTRRTGDGDDDAMTRLAATVARTEGLRIDLDGLTEEETAALVRCVDPTIVSTAALWQRSGGNPFFLTELALAGGDLSGSLADVVHARVMALTPATVTALQAASVLDVAFDARLLSLMLGRGEAETATLLQAATAVGLVVEQGDADATHAFTHAVLREVVYTDQTPTALATWHAAAARALTDRGDLRRVEHRAAVTHHWERAGRSHAGAGWRGVLKAATHARTDKAYAEEARHLGRAALLLEQDPTAGERERFELLMLRADACRWSGDWVALSDAVDRAIVVAERIGDDALAARAAISVAEGALRHVRPFGYVHRPIVDALERLLFRLGDGEAALRCRAQVALAMELYFDPHQTERLDALVEEAMRFAEGTDDLRLQFTTYHGAFVATWRLDTVERRARIAERALEAARRLDDPRALVFAETLALGVASELGDAERVRQGLDRVIDLAVHRGLTIPEGVLRVLAVGWASMHGDLDAVAEQVEALTGLMRHASSFVATATGTVVTAALLSGDAGRLHAAVAGFVPEVGFPTEVIGATLLIRFGQAEAAAAVLADVEVDLATHTFLGPLNAALACHVGAALGATPLTERAYAYLAGHAGRMCSAAAAAALGPVDLHLALGAHALGDDDAARRHLDDAERLVAAWQLPGLRHELDHVAGLVGARRSQPDPV